jgi:hypothetical protein
MEDKVACIVATRYHSEKPAKDCLQMSYANVAKVIGGAVFAGILFAAGYVASNIRGKGAREDIEKENERLRTYIRAYFSTVKAANTNMEAAMADIASNPPSTKKDLVARLRKHGVLDQQVDNILAELEAQGAFRNAA